VFNELADEAGQLRARQPRDLGQILPQQALVGLAEPGVAEAAQFGGYPAIDGLTAGRLEAQRCAAFEKSPDLIQALETFGSECHDHPPMIPDPEPPSGSLLVGNTRPLQAHLSLDKASPCPEALSMAKCADELSCCHRPAAFVCAVATPTPGGTLPGGGLSTRFRNDA